jgi:ADP-heptose:LPS heptosyltransferase
MPAPPTADRIAILRLGAVGDVVRTLPAASAVRRGYPDARIAWVVEPASAALLRAQPWVDEVLVFPRPDVVDRLRARAFDAAWATWRGFVRELRARRFDLVLDFHSILKSGVIGLASGARLRVGYGRPYGREASWLLTNERAHLVPERCSRFERNAALVAFLGLDATPDPAPLRVPEATRGALRERLGGARPVVIHPGTSDGTPHKRWTPEGYAKVAAALAEAPGAPVMVTAGPARDDRRLADAIVAGSGGAARHAPATGSLIDLAALFAESRLYVGSDTGPMHVASLVGTPVVQILGPTDPVENRPFDGTPSRTVRVPVACSPCRRGCGAATCMAVVPPDRVIDAARELLAEAWSADARGRAADAR